MKMLIQDIEWVHPCGCGGCSLPRSEVQTANGQFRIKQTKTGYAVQRFSKAGLPMSTDASGAPAYEPVTAAALEAMLA